jgi:hypothetical protein
MMWWTWAIGVAAAAWYLKKMGFSIHDEVYERKQIRAMDTLTLRHRKRMFLLEELTQVYPSDEGQMPLLAGLLPDGKVIVRDPNTMRAYTFTETMEKHGDVEQANYRIELARALSQGHAARLPDGTGMDPAELNFVWPDSYSYSQMLNRYVQRPSYKNFLLGVTYDEMGQEKPVIEAMEDLVHIMIGGRSGFGKSNLAFVLAKQLVDSVDECRFAAIDYAGTTMLPLQASDRMLYPVATDQDQAMSVLYQVYQELQRRKALFQQHPGVTKFSQYEGLGEDLVPWFLFVDEMPAVTRKVRIRKMLTEVSEQSRKFGLWIIAGGTTWHANVVPEEIRVNYGPRLAMACSKVTSRVVLDNDPSAGTLKKKGHAYALLPGQDVQRILTPEIAIEAVQGTGPICSTMPRLPMEMRSKEEKRQDVIAYLRQGTMTHRQIEIEAFGHAGGDAHTVVSQEAKKLLDTEGID